MGYTLYKRLRRLLFRFKNESTLLRKTMHRVFIVLNRMHHFLNIPNPLKNMEISIQPDRTLRNEDFISPDEEKG